MSQNPLNPLQSPLLGEAAEAGIRHGFFTRQGGVSQGLYEGLNVGLGSKDDPEKVRENRRLVAAWFGAPVERLATVHQVHSADVVAVDDAFLQQAERPHADGMVTATPGIVLGVLAADCGPVLFADPKARVIGAAHAGWKGALNGVLESTIEAMTKLGASRNAIRACLGPSISQANYEVGPEFMERFVAHDARYNRYFQASQKPGHAIFDLKALSVDRLLGAGITAESLDLCTYPDAAHFYSYRRMTHLGEADYGRQISAIALMAA